MTRSRLFNFCFRDACVRHGSVCVRPFSLSCPKWDGRQSFLKSKLASLEGDIAGETWFPNLISPSPATSLPKEVAVKLVRKLQSEGEEEEAEPVWRSLPTRGTKQTTVVEDVSQLFREDGSVNVDPVYLRDSCRCSLCVDGSTLQKNFVTAHIPQDIEAVFKGRSTHGRVKVGWKNDIPGFSPGHQSVYAQSYLRALTSPPPPPRVARKRQYWDQETLAKRVNWISYDDFMNDSEAFKDTISALHRDGIIFVRGAEQSEETVIKMAERIGPMRNTFYGSNWNVKSIPNSKNVAYTNQYLGFHMDMLYLSDPPAYQFLHVLQNSCSGGESRFADAFCAATRLRRSNEQAYRLLCKYPMEWMYDNDGQSYSQRRPTFQQVSNFLTGEEKATHRIERRADRAVDADLAYVNWSPPFQGRLFHNPEAPERTSSFLKALKEFDRILNSDHMVFELKMEQGTCAVFENRRVVHARNAFKTEDGERWLRGAYVDEEGFWSKCHALGADQYDTTGIPQPEGPVVRSKEV